MSEFPNNRGSASGSIVAYTVEARCTYKEPQQIANQIFGHEWKEIPHEPSPIGVPNKLSEWHPELTQRGRLMEYPTAQALRWWFHAEANQRLGISLIETRLVEHLIKYSSEITAVAEHDIVGPEDRSSSRPIRSPATAPQTQPPTK